MKLAGAPISWGVCEVPGWGLQLPAERVLDEMDALGLEATEAGPPGFLPADPADARALLDARELRLVGGFVTAVLHDPARRSAELASIERQAAWLADGGADVLVLACATGRPGYSTAVELDAAGWAVLFESLDRVAEIARARGLTLAVHPHWGTAIERAAHVARLVSGCAHGLCLDTGHVRLGGYMPDRLLEEAAARVVHVHLKDVDRALAADVLAGRLDYAAAVRRGLFVPLGDGDARIAEALGLLRRSGYRGWYVLEQDVMLEEAPQGIPSRISSSVAFARRHA